ncbi:MAG TPA: hypothetical protein VN369_01520 [Terriglobales bacterium]|nr:hypothetical protein [Terriglobales bacterium]
MTLTEKVAYIKGLMDGLDIDKDKKEGKVLTAIVDLLDDMAEEVTVLEDSFDELDEQVAMIDEDLDEVEGFVYGDDEETYEVECPSCGNIFYIDEDTALEGETVCPECGEEIEIEIDDEDEDDEDDDEDDDCGCGCGGDCCDSH